MHFTYSDYSPIFLFQLYELNSSFSHFPCIFWLDTFFPSDFLHVPRPRSPSSTSLLLPFLSFLDTPKLLFRLPLVFFLVIFPPSFLYMELAARFFENLLFLFLTCELKKLHMLFNCSMPLSV